MIKIQRIYKVQYSNRTEARLKHEGKYLGLTPGYKDYIYESDNTLLYSHNKRAPKGYSIFKVQKVEGSGNRAQVTIPAAWAKDHCKDMMYVKAIYENGSVEIEPHKAVIDE